MVKKFDLIVRGGTVVDGLGGASIVADVGIVGDRICAVGKISDSGAAEVDARGKIVTPGFVDIHTHYDGQITWDESLAPSSQHGVTTVVMGNCGVGFAPCRAEMRDSLVRLMEGVEDIPGAVLTEGVPWKWETFPEYLDFLDTRRCDVDFAAMVPHGALRIYAMGERGVRGERASFADMKEMARVVKEAVGAGALGFSTSRSLTHRGSDGVLSPCVTATEDEFRAIAIGLRDAGTGIIEAADFMADATEEYSTDFQMWRRLAEASGRPMALSLAQTADVPERWRHLMHFFDEAVRDGVPIKAEISSRPLGILYGLTLSAHAFMSYPSYMAIAALPLAERVKRMRDPAFKEKLLAEKSTATNPFQIALHRDTASLYQMKDPPDFAPPAEDKLGERARRLGVTPLELLYDTLLEEEGHAILYHPFINYVYNNLEPIREMLENPNTLVALADGGAHIGFICDASQPTFFLSYWARDRGEGRIPLERAVQMLTSDPARFVGLEDRGVVAPGYKADLNIIDFDRLRLHRPYAKHDLPAGGLRLHQRADGYVATVVSGAVTYREGAATGVYPGRLVRGAKAAPA